MMARVAEIKGRKDKTGRRKSCKKCLFISGLLLAGILAAIFVLQRGWAHRNGQEHFVQSKDVVCTPLLGWFTREDKRVDEKTGAFIQGEDFADLQPGDILLTLSTHSLGWRHGHAGLVIDKDRTLECMILGSDSCYADPQEWRTYSGYCVLRVKGVSAKQQQAVAEYACSDLRGVPYHLTAGFIGAKAPASDRAYFGLQCAYLVWYAWNHFGYDLDADGGRLVTCTDILQSDLVEVVQVLGMEVK